MTFVVDASVALKWFVEEDGSERAAALLASKDLLIAPDLIVPEVCDAAGKPSVAEACYLTSRSM